MPNQSIKFGEGALQKLAKAGYGSPALDLAAHSAKATIGDDLRDFGETQQR